MSELTAREVMTAGVEAIPQQLSVRDLATFLIDNEISGAPVEDDDGQLVGVVSVTDIARVTSEGGAGIRERRTTFYMPDWEKLASPNELDELHLEDDDLMVRDIMTPTILAVDAHLPVSEVAKAMLEGHVHRLLVIEDDRVVGIVSSTDLLQVLVRGAVWSQAAN